MIMMMEREVDKKINGGFFISNLSKRGNKVIQDKPSKSVVVTIAYAVFYYTFASCTIFI